MEINKIELVAVYLTGPGLQAEFRLEDIGTITYTFPYSFCPREDKHKRPDLFINAIKEIAKEWKEEKRVVEYRKVRNCIKSDDLGCLVTRRNHDDSFHEASICQNRILKEDIQNGYCEFYSSGSGRSIKTRDVYVLTNEKQNFELTGVVTGKCKHDRMRDTFLAFKAEMTNKLPTPTFDEGWCYIKQTFPLPCIEGDGYWTFEQYN